MKATLPIRTQDKWGQGHYGASRGSRKHKGIDYACCPDTEIYPTCPGQVTKIGYCYPDDLKWRYVEIRDSRHFKHRYFYLNPKVEVGYEVTTDDILGTVQDLTERYPGITVHCHYEVKDGNKFLNPDEV